MISVEKGYLTIRMQEDTPAERVRALRAALLEAMYRVGAAQEATDLSGTLRQLHDLLTALEYHEQQILL